MRHETIDPGDVKLKGKRLNELEEQNVLTVWRTPEGQFKFVEQCDEWFYTVLTREQFQEFLEELVDALNA